MESAPTGGAATTATSAPPGAAKQAMQDPRLQLLEGAIKRAVNNNKPVILVNTAAVSWQHVGQLEPQLLAALRGGVIKPTARISPPTEHDIYTPVNLMDRWVGSLGCAGGGEEGVLIMVVVHAN